MRLERHPFRGVLSGLLMGLGAATMAIIYGVIRVDTLAVPLAIVLVFGVIGGLLAMFWPAPEDLAVD
jgi:hypothetical protein